MRIAINADSRRVTTWANEVLAEGLHMTRRDKFPVEVKFISGPSYVALPEGATGKLNMKVPGAYDSVPVVESEWTASGAGRSAVYTFFVELDTPELAALFAEEPAEVNLVLEIEWVYAEGAFDRIRQTSAPVAVRVANDYIRDVVAG